MSGRHTDIEARVAALSPERRRLLEQRRRRLRAAQLEAAIPRRTKDFPAPLSFAQERLWFLDRLAPGRTDYHMAASLRLAGEVDDGALAAAVTWVVERHEPLRSAVTVRDGVPHQVAGAAGAEPLRVHDLTGLAADRRLAEAHRLTTVDSREPFDLSTGPLFRCSLFRLDKADHLFAVAVHHIAFDGWSIEVFARELGSAYAALCRGWTPALPDLPLGYGDFAAWQRSWVAGRLDGLVQRWQDSFGPPPDRLAIGTGPSLAPGAVLAGERTALAVPPSLGRAVRQLATAEGTTTTIVLLAGWAALLGRATGQDDLLIGIPVAGRTRPELEPLVGLFANTLAVRIDGTKAASFRDLIRQSRLAVSEAWATQELPFEYLVRVLDPPRTGPTPLLSAAFSPQNFARQVDIGTIAGVLQPASTGNVALEVTLAVRQDRDELSGYLEYALDALDAGQASELAEAYVQLLTQVTSAPDTDRHRLPGADLVRRTAPALPCAQPAPELSRTQLLVYLGQLLHPRIPLYNQVLLVSLTGAIDPDRFSAAFADVVARTDALRLRIDSTGDRPSPIVSRDATFHLDIVDLAGQPRPDEALAAFAAERSARPFDLADALGDAALIRLGADRWAWYLCLHHLVTDAQSSWLLLRRVLGAYLGARDERDTGGIGILELGHAERAWLASPRGVAAQEYWAGVLARPVRRPTWYGRTPREGATRAVRCRIDLDAPAIDRLRAAHDDAGLRSFSPEQAIFTMIAAVTVAWLRRISGEDRVTLGVPFHNRATRVDRATVGPLMSVCPLVLDVAPHDTLATLAGRVAAELRAALPHVRAGVPNRPGDRVYDVLLNIQVFTLAELPGSMVDAVRLTNAGHEFDTVTITGVSTDGLASLELLIDLNDTAFPAGNADRAADDLRRLLAADPDHPVDAIQLAPPAPTPPVPAAEPLARQILGQAARAPDAIAVSGAEGQLSYAGLVRRAVAVAGCLRDAGVGIESPVGVLAGRTPGAVVALLGTLLAGGAYLPLDPTWPPERLAAVVAESGTRIVLATSALSGRVPDLATVIEVDRAARHRPSESIRFSEPPAAAVLAILFTSGATGRPKGVLIEHGAMASYARTAAKIFEATAADRVLGFAAPSFDTSLEEIFSTLTAGATLVPRGDGEIDTPDEFLRRCAAERLTVLDLPTSYWHVLVRELGPRLAALPSSVRLVVVGGEAVAGDAVTAWHDTVGDRIRLLNTYGPTEATVVATACELDAATANGDRVPIGRPVDGALVRVLTPLSAAVPAGVPGELVIAGTGVARGYLGQPRLTAERFVPDPGRSRPGARAYRTGDRGRIDECGATVFLGRLDRQAKIRGHRVEPAEVEAVLAGHPTVRQAAVLVRGGTDDTHLVALVERPTGDPGATEELAAYLAGRLPSAALPRWIDTIDRLPLTERGKVDYAALEGLADQRRPTSGAVPTGPRTPTEAAVAALWADLVETDAETVDVHRDFFAAGGHSLLATVLVARAEQALGVRLGLAAFFAAPTVAGLARAIDAASPDVRRPALRRLPRLPGERLPLSPTQRQLWYLDRLDPGRPTWNLPAVVRLTGTVDVAALRRALLTVIERHDVLRTTFGAEAGHPYQIVGPVPDLRVATVDLTGLSEPDRAAQLVELAERDARTPFDLTTGPLLRATVVRLRTGDRTVRGVPDSAVLLCLHHIVADGWSVGVLVRELHAYYGAELTGTAPALPAPRVRYTDVAIWQEALMDTDEFADALRWWVASLDGAPPRLELPTDLPRPRVATHRGHTHHFTLGAETVRAVRALSTMVGTTPFVVLLAAFAALLHRLSGAQDLVIGTPVSGRTHPDTEDLVGAFMNSLPLRIRVDTDPRFTDLVVSASRHTQEALARQEVPLDAIVRALNPRRAAAHDPLFQVMFTFLNEPTRAALATGPAMEIMDIDRGSANRDLTLRIEDAVAGGTDDAEPVYRAHLEGARDLFEPTTIDAIAERFTTVLRAVLADPRTRLSAIELAPLRTTPEVGARSRFERAMRRPTRRVDPHEPDLVRFGDQAGLAVLATPSVRGVDLAGWVAGHRAVLDHHLHTRGAVLFRGFEIADHDTFQRTARAAGHELTAYEEASTPRTRVSGLVYTSTEYPPNEPIMLHNELAYAHQWPRQLWFWCRRPADRGGATPLADSRRVLAALDPALVDRLTRAGIGYLRNFGPHLDIPWQRVFGDDQESVAARCREWGMEYEWLDAGRLRTRAIRQATARHPDTGERVWFNSAHMFHVASLPESARAIRGLLDAEDLPRNAFAGDGSAIEDDTIAHIRQTYRREATRFDWRAGDVLVIDNLLVSHGRDAFEGRREVLVAMTGTGTGSVGS